MREILFRGKIKGLTDWSYGYYAKNGENHFILLDTESEDNYSIVDESTVGQYTGLTDKNGIKIFEGDILKIVSWTNTGKRIDCAIVMPDDKTGGYRLKVYHNGKYKRISRFTANHLYAYEAEIIGNIHDNPELLNN